MAAPDQVAVAAEAAAAQLAVSSAGLLGAPNYAEPTLIDCILGDHRMISCLFAHFQAAAASRHEHVMQMTAGSLVQLIMMHSQAEHQTLYPLLESLGGGSTDNAALAVRERAAHQLVEADLAAVLGAVHCTLMGPQAPVEGNTVADLAAAVQALQAHLSAHMVEEEALVLPRLAAAFSRDALALHGKNFEAAKLGASFLPATLTRMHKEAPGAATGAAGTEAVPMSGATVTTGVPGEEAGAHKAAPARIDSAGEEAPMATS